MASGLLIDLNDGRPMAITSGLRCLSFSRQVSSITSGSLAVTNYMSGDTVVYIPDQYIRIQNEPGLFQIHYIMSVNQSGSNVSMTIGRNLDKGARETQCWPGQIWKFSSPSQSGNSGLLISDSTDFTMIPTGQAIGSATYIANVTINGSWNMPVSGVCFASWNSSSVVLERRGNTIYCKALNEGALGDPGNGSVNARVVIFQNVKPTAGVGLNYFNSSGVCTFSTTRKPFVIKSMVRPSTSWASVSGMVPLGVYGMVYRSNGGNTRDGRYKGLMMNNGNIRIANGSHWGSYYDEYGSNADVNCSISIPVIPDFY